MLEYFNHGMQFFRTLQKRGRPEDLPLLKYSLGNPALPMQVLQLELVYPVIPLTACYVLARK